MRTALPLLAAIVALLWGCSVATTLRVFNNTGDRIGLRLSILGTRFERTVWLDQGEQRLVYSPELIYLPEKNDRLPIYHRRCRYEYEVLMPEEGYFRPGQGASINLQVEPDLSVFLMPGDAQARMARTELAKVQRAGFPMRPISRNCGKGHPG